METFLMKQELKSLLSAIIFFSLSVPSIAMASTFSGGDGSKVQFVKPLANLANAMELSAAALIVIAIVTIVGVHMLHREDMGGLIRNMIFLIISGAVILAGGSFLSQVGLTTTASLFP